MYNTFNPYEAVAINRQHTKNFFKKPFTLITALLFVACAILPTVYYFKLTDLFGEVSDVSDYISSSLGGLFLAPIEMEELFGTGAIIIMIASILAPLLIAVALFMMFAASRNSNPNIWGKTGCSALIGGAGIASFGLTYTACMIIFPLIDLFDRIGDNKLSDEQTSYVVRLIVTTCVFLLYSISFGIFARSIYKNMNSPKPKGCFAACFFAVSSILVGTVYMLFIIDISESTSGSMSDDGKLLLSVFALSAVNYVVTAAFALMYCSHLKKQPTAPFVPAAAPAQQTVPVYSQPVSAPACQAPVTAAAPSAPAAPLRESESTAAVELSDVPAFCPECGNAVTSNQLFCAQCGTKLN